MSEEGPLDLWPGMHDRIAFPPDHVAKLSQVWLNGRLLPAPADPERLLSEHRYGPDWRTPTRPIVSLATRQVVPSTQMTAPARELLPWLAERDAVLRGLMWKGRSERMRDSRAGRWLVRAGLPPDPAEPGPDEADPALVSAERSLAWTEQAITELEHPTRLLAAKRWQRRAARLARRVV